MLRINRKLSGISWAIGYSIAPRVFQGIKFLLFARILGPLEFGAYAFALLWIAIAEGVSEFGFKQAIIQSQNAVDDDQLNSAASILVIRGVFVTLLITVTGFILSQYFMIVDFISVSLISVIPLFRCLYVIPIAIKLRNLEYKRMCVFESSWRFFDVVTGMFFVLYFASTSRVALASTALAEFIALIVSFKLLDNKIVFSCKLSLVKQLTLYGRWIWAQSIFTVLLNQVDKLMVVGNYGTIAMGAYQGISRLAQLCIADPINMMVNAWFPKLAYDIRVNEAKAWSKFLCVIKKYMLAMSLVVIVTTVFRTSIIDISFGSKWHGYEAFLPIFSLSMSLGGMITLLVTWFRSVGSPQYVTFSTVTQLSVYIPSLLLLGKREGAIGVAYAVLLSGFAALVSLMICLKKKRMQSIALSVNASLFFLSALTLIVATNSILNWNFAIDLIGLVVVSKILIGFVQFLRSRLSGNDKNYAN